MNRSKFFLEQAQKLGNQVWYGTNWKLEFLRILKKENIKKLAYSPISFPFFSPSLENELKKELGKDPKKTTKFFGYQKSQKNSEDQKPKDQKKELLTCEASFILSDSAIAKTGSLVLTSKEGRLLSLVPGIQILLISENQIVDTLSDWFKKQNTLASQVVLVSGPSRTADIEFQVTLGVHGPKKSYILLTD